MSLSQFWIHVWLSDVLSNVGQIWLHNPTRSYKHGANDYNIEGTHLLITKNKYKMNGNNFQLVGLAFERNLVLCPQGTNVDGTEKNSERKYFENITFVDIVHYAFNYIGLLTGMIICEIRTPLSIKSYYSED